MNSTILRFLLAATLICVYFHSTSSEIIGKVPVTGKVYWEEFFYIDNTDNDAEITRVEERESVLTSSIEEFENFIVSVAGSFVAGFNVGGKFEMIEAGVYAELSLKLNVTFQSLTKRRESTYESRKSKNTYTCGANSELTLYRKVYEAPGFSYQTDALTTEELPEEEWLVEVTIRQ